MRMSLAGHLKAETKSAHIKVEKARLLRQIFSPTFGIEDYQHLLFRWYAFFTAIDKDLHELEFEGYQYVPRSPALESDICGLGLDFGCAAIPQYSGWRPKTFEERVGCVYVIEGSSLGAQIITRRLVKMLGETVSKSIVFYQMQPYAWESVQTWLDRLGHKSSCDPDMIAESATRMFFEIHDLMDA